MSTQKDEIFFTSFSLYSILPSDPRMSIFTRQLSLQRNAYKAHKLNDNLIPFQLEMENLKRAADIHCLNLEKVIVERIKQLEESLEEEMPLPVEVPQYVRIRVTNFYKEYKNIPKFLYERTSKLESVGKGIFTNDTLAAKIYIGRYSGKVIYKEKEWEQSTSPKILELSFLNVTIWVDAKETWSGLINHKWKWPFKDMNTMPPQWKLFFSNIEVIDPGDYIKFFPGDLVTIIKIGRNEELYLDYGKEFWAKERPKWVLSSAKSSMEIEFQKKTISFLKALDTVNELKELKDISEVIILND